LAYIPINEYLEQIRRNNSQLFELHIGARRIRYLFAHLHRVTITGITFEHRIALDCITVLAWFLIFSISAALQSDDLSAVSAQKHHL
jgi:hypothetical protein